MKINHLHHSLAFLFIIVVTASCQAPRELVYRDFKNLKVDKLGFGASTLNVDLIYYNPNNFGLQLRNTDLDIFVDSNYLGHSSQELQINIPRLSEFTLPLQIQVDMKNALKNTLPSLFGKEVLVKVTGRVKLGKANVYKSFTVNYESLQRFSVF